MGLLYFYGDWFGLTNLLPVSTFILIGYFSISLAMSIYFVAVDFEKEKIALA
jgi:alkylglycerol monooxygenase